MTQVYLKTAVNWKYQRVICIRYEILSGQFTVCSATETVQCSHALIAGTRHESAPGHVE